LIIIINGKCGELLTVDVDGDGRCEDVDLDKRQKIKEMVLIQ